MLMEIAKSNLLYLILVKFIQRLKIAKYVHKKRFKEVQ